MPGSSLKFPLGLLACLLLAGPRIVRAVPAESDGQVAAREVALEMAGAFTNDGYKIRDGHWSGLLKPDAAQVIVVNLYAGNQYYFSASAGPTASNRPSARRAIRSDQSAAWLTSCRLMTTPRPSSCARASTISRTST